MSRFYECHGHALMDGTDYAAIFGKLCASGVSYFRDGGDADGKTADAKAYCQAHPELGIEYVTPVFAIHRKGRYGKIVGRPFEDLKEFRDLIRRASALGADFIKIMYSGIVTFKEFGQLSTPPLDAAEIKELVNIAHGEGFSVMAHCNGRDTIMAAIEAGTDSIEHGVFMDAECISALAGSCIIWVPTIAAIAAFAGRSGYGERAVYHTRPGFDAAITRQTIEYHMDSVRKAAAFGKGSPSSGRVLIAAGSDCGAFGVPFGSGTLSEYGLLMECGLSAEDIIAANEMLRGRFHR